MSSSRHPIALSVERRVGGATKLLATVMCLPLIDGIFPALVLAGALDSALGIVEVGLLIFGGSATVAVILAEMDGTRREQIQAVAAVGAVLLVGAAVVAVIAPTIRDMLAMAVFERFAGVVILAVAAKTASARVGEVLPRPAIVVGLGLVASLEPAGASLTLTTDLGLVLRAVAAAGVGVAFALGVAITAPWLRNAVDIDRFRFGSAVALGVLPLSIFELLPSNAPIALAVLGITFLFAFDPERAREPDATYDSGVEGALADGGDPADPAAEPVDDAASADPVGATVSPDDATAAAEDATATADAEEDDDEETFPERVSNYVMTDDERAPWM